MEVEIVKIDEMDKILEAGLLSTPGFAIEDEIKSVGRSISRGDQEMDKEKA